MAKGVEDFQDEGGRQAGGPTEPWLHHDPGHERSQRDCNMCEHWRDDAREDDAELFAPLVLMGLTSARPYRGPGQTHWPHTRRTTGRSPRGTR